jgi:hypothetical protein
MCSLGDSSSVPRIPDSGAHGTSRLHYSVVGTGESAYALSGITSISGTSFAANFVE